jgi:hypothetical protein
MLFIDLQVHAQGGANVNDARAGEPSGAGTPKAFTSMIITSTAVQSMD